MNLRLLCIALIAIFVVSCAHKNAVLHSANSTEQTKINLISNDAKIGESVTIFEKVCHSRPGKLSGKRMGRTSRTLCDDHPVGQGVIDRIGGEQESITILTESEINFTNDLFAQRTEDSIKEGRLPPSGNLNDVKKTKH